MQPFSPVKPHKILDPNFASKIRHSFTQQGPIHLGAELEAIEEGSVTVSLPYSKYVRQQHGLFHGGMVSMLADTASGFAGYTVLPPDEECVSAEFKINFLYPARGSKLIATGNVIKVGRTLMIAQAVVSVVTPAEETIECALMIHTLARVKHLKTTNDA